MSIRKWVGRVATMALLGVGAVVGVSATTTAVAFAACAPEYDYGIGSYSSYFVAAPNTHLKDGPGGKITVSIIRTVTISSSSTSLGGASLAVIVVTAQHQISSQIVKSESVSITHSYEHAIAAGKYGNVQYGSWGYAAHWTYYHFNSNCTSTLISSGTAYLPVTATGWRYWETSS